MRKFPQIKKLASWVTVLSSYSIWLRRDINLNGQSWQCRWPLKRPSRKYWRRIYFEFLILKSYYVFLLLPSVSLFSVHQHHRRNHHDHNHHNQLHHQHYNRPQCYYLTFSCPRWCWLRHCSSQSWRSYLSTQRATRRFQSEKQSKKRNIGHDTFPSEIWAGKKDAHQTSSRVITKEERRMRASTTVSKYLSSINLREFQKEIFFFFFILWNNMTITMRYWFQFDNKLHIFHGKKSWRQILWRKSSNLDICSLCLYHSCQNGDSGSPIQHGQVLAWRISNCWWWWWWR